MKKKKRNRFRLTALNVMFALCTHNCAAFVSAGVIPCRRPWCAPCGMRPRRHVIGASAPRRVRRAAMRMGFDGGSSERPATPDDGQDESDGEEEPNDETSDAELVDDNDDAAPQFTSASTPSSTEFHFSQEVLRRRISALNERKRTTGKTSTDAVLDLSVVADSNRSDEIAEETMDEEEVSRVIDAFDNLSRVFVILFTNARDGTEGVYSLSVGEENIVLAFEERHEAQRYAVCLEAQKFPQPQIAEMDPHEIRDFCYDAGIKLGFIPSGMVIVPPDESVVDDLDKWRGTPSSDSSGSTGMTEEDIDAMRKRFDTLFGQ